MKSSYRLALKRLITCAYRHLPRAYPRRIVLSYHAVGSGPWSTSARQFEEQIDWLKDHARFRSVDSLISQPPTSDALQVAISFDDGYRSVLTQAAPVLQRAGATATVFVNTSQIADTQHVASDPTAGYYPDEQFMLWSELDELRNEGWQIASHCVEHPDLPTQSSAVIRDQLQRSKCELEQRLATPCSGLAYPFGRADARVRAIAAECGYAWAVCSTHGRLTPSADRFALPRIDIRNNYSLGDFVAAVQGDLDYLGLVQMLRHRFRFYR